MLDRFAKFSYSIAEIHRCWHKLAAEELARYALNSPHAIYLKTLFDSEPEGITAAQLGEICGKDKADVSRMVAILENKGLVRKVAVGKNMDRAKLVLTETGREAAEHVRSRAAVAVELAGSGLSEDEREQFYKALTLITENLRKLSKDGLPQK